MKSFLEELTLEASLEKGEGVLLGGNEGKSITAGGGGLEQKPGNVEKLLRVGRVVWSG